MPNEIFQKRGRFPPSLFKRLSGVYNLEGVKAIQWGRLHEKVAIEHFKNTMNLEVQETGIWLTNSGLLGATPDGLVQDDAIIEVKCPYSYRSDVLSETLKSTSSYIIHFNEEGDVVVNNTHHYYHQIQGLLHILNRSICYLCIWTTKEAIIAPIERDVEILENFVTQQYVPSLM
ncbi:YqaJ-like viral recombinase domain [Popillia japonica]|uniref:YqaJ-like viral recombinase domain n=1 Tax=Popillia japonica TaxID=7064 RepID=A0AAW1MG96_POPJA